MSISLIGLIIFVAAGVAAGVLLALIDHYAPLGWQDADGWHAGEPPTHITEEELQKWN